MSLSADELLKRAEKKATSSGGWFTSKQSQKEEAVELFKDAANKLRADNRLDESGAALVRAAELEIAIGEKDFAANTYYEASKCFRMSRPDRTLTSFTSRGRDGAGALLRHSRAAWPVPPGG